MFWSIFPLTAGDYSFPALLPYGPDSFYHATRILEAFHTHTPIAQFDPHIHQPNGTWVAWPWGFDTLMVWILGILTKIFPSASVQSLLLVIPPGWVVVNTLALAHLLRAMRIPPVPGVAGLLLFSLLPITQNIHLVGRIDHHFAELTAILLATSLGYTWLARQRRMDAVLLGTLLGIAPAIHNGLFVLQLPLVACLLWIWLRRSAVPERTDWLATGVAIGTALAVLPSVPLWEGVFSFTLLSWFHVYVAALTITAIVYVTIARPDKATLLLGGALLLVLLAPLYWQISDGLEFIRADIPFCDHVDEVRSLLVFDGSRHLDLSAAIRLYSALLLLLPANLLFMLVWTARRPLPERIYLTLCIVLHTFFFLHQARFSYYGIVPLLVPPILGLSALTRRSALPRALQAGLLMALVAIIVQPSLKSMMMTRQLGGSYDFEMTYPIFEAISRQCDRSPGTILADFNDGHYLRFFTRCGVIANSFLLTPQDIAQVRETERLLSGDPETIVRYEPWISYVYVRRDDNLFDGKEAARLRQTNRRVPYELLFGATLPQGYERIKRIDVYLSPDRKEPMAGFFALHRNSAD